MPERVVQDSEIAMLRGIRNCGQHHEENKTSPAILFANECAYCAGAVYSVIYNHGALAQYNDIALRRRL